MILKQTGGPYELRMNDHLLVCDVAKYGFDEVNIIHLLEVFWRGPSPKLIVEFAKFRPGSF